MKFNRTLILNLMYLPALIFNYIQFIIRGVKYENFPDIKGVITLRGKGKLIIGKRCKINSSIKINPVGLSGKCLFYISKGSRITIGNNVGISNSLFYSINNIEVQDNVLIGGGCQILDNDFHSLNYEERINNSSYIKSKPVLIKEGAFIGASSIILKGVTIGRKSIVGAGSVVTRDIPDNEIWAGNPAVFIRKM